jgi:hypothetical protein
VTDRHFFGPLFSSALLALVVVASACKKHEGGACKSSEQVCADKEHALVCRSGQFVTVACPGPLACSRFENRVNCDTTMGNVGDNCMGEDDEYACSSDKKQVVVCKKGKFESYLQCRGATGCAMDGKIPNCDVSVAAKGDPCQKPETFACAADAQQMLICRLGKFETFRYCRGANGCTVRQSEGPACDESLSMLGDPCGTPGQIGCSSDGKTELICQGGVFMKSRSCKTSCTISTKNGRAVECK